MAKTNNVILVSNILKLVVGLAIVLIPLYFFVINPSGQIELRSKAGLTTTNLATSGGIELLGDTNFKNGVSVGFANTYPDSSDLACIERWKQKIPSMSSARWMLWEITERFYFCDNPQNPFLNPNGVVEYISPNAGIKKLTTNNSTGSVRMALDTKWEWRTGCNLCKSESVQITKDPAKYGNPLTNWPHFLIGQVLSTSYRPKPYAVATSSIPLDERVYLSRYDAINFKGSFRLNTLAKSIPNNCPSGDWKSNSCKDSVCVGDCPVIPNHAIFYLAFVMWANTPVSDMPKVIYQLVPLIYSEDGVTNIPRSNPLIMPDQFGDLVYFSNVSTTEAPILVKNDWVNVNLDVLELSKKTLADINASGKYPKQVSLKNYHLGLFLSGWEIWGGYNTDIEMNSMSLKAVPLR